MFVDGNHRCSISKGEFLENFVQLYRAVKDYEALLSEFAKQDGTEAKSIQTMLQDRVNGMQFDGLNVRAMEMMGAYLRSTLDHYKGDKLNFFLPEEPNDEFFKADDSYVELSSKIEEVEEQLEEIQARVFYITRLLPPRNIEKLRLILKGIARLFKSIVPKDFDDLEVNLNHLHHLTANRESFFLINEIGKMVRGIHNSLQDFSETVPTDKLDPGLMDDMPDAVDKLNLVIQRMEQAANSTLDQAEALLDFNAENSSKTEGMLETCEQVEEKLAALQIENPALAESLGEVAALMHNGIKEELLNRAKVFQESEAIYFEIIANQSYQDLTGQTLKKIINFIEQLEIKLLDILQKYSGKPKAAKKAASEDAVSPLTGIERDGLLLEGPQDNHPTDMTKQADIDKMLANFGF